MTATIGIMITSGKLTAGVVLLMLVTLPNVVLLVLVTVPFVVPANVPSDVLYDSPFDSFSGVPGINAASIIVC